MKAFYLFLFLFTAGQVFAQDNDFIKEDLRKAERSNEYVYEANELLNKDEFISAEKKYREAISEKNSNVAGNYNLGNSYYEKGNYDEALFRHLEAAKVANTKKEKHRAYHNIGNVLMKKESCQEAVEAYKNALRNDPTDDETRYNYALAKECAEQQKDQKNDQNDKDQDKDKEEEKKDEDKKDGENEDEDKNEEKDKGDKNENEGDNKNEQPNENKNDQEKGQDQKDQPQQPKPQPGQLSPQQIKSLLEAMNNQEQKVQEKMNAEKRKGVKVEAEKDW